MEFTWWNGDGCRSVYDSRPARYNSAYRDGELDCGWSAALGLLPFRFDRRLDLDGLRSCVVRV